MKRGATKALQYSPEDAAQTLVHPSLRAAGPCWASWPANSPHLMFQSISVRHLKVQRKAQSSSCSSRVRAASCNEAA